MRGNRYRNRYRSSEQYSRQRRKGRALSFLLIVGLLGCGVWMCYGAWSRWDIGAWMSHLFETKQGGVDEEEHGQFCRLCREVIPAVDFNNGGYKAYFNDINDLHLAAAKKLGIGEKDMGKEPLKCGMKYIYSNDLYYVAPMYYGKPFLVEPAYLLVQYIGERFATVVAEQYNDGHTYKPIITSALRSCNDVKLLCNTNSNASENSSHIYGTTIDITYTRFMRDDGLEVSDLWLKEALAQTLYELRYEGLCYVIYEVRQPCFHITVRNIEYSGTEKNEYKTYNIHNCTTLHSGKTFDDEILKYLYPQSSVQIPMQRDSNSARGWRPLQPNDIGQSVETKQKAEPPQHPAATQQEVTNYLML